MWAFNYGQQVGRDEFKSQSMEVVLFSIYFWSFNIFWLCIQFWLLVTKSYEYNGEERHLEYIGAKEKAIQLTGLCYDFELLKK